ncbi:hypothetical protein QFZ40_001437 [Arthrobacter pascens]|uniref:hypothetical protein n=1 Tax=Arthrobacter pascens TaxID=1677 RepID=UPI002783A77D|nr:hypothetical protein [Arthrobacter pascens]MDQ0633528.1 hypothetical protein [Arthrobacter pascens]
MNEPTGVGTDAASSIFNLPHYRVNGEAPTCWPTSTAAAPATDLPGLLDTGKF